MFFRTFFRTLLVFGLFSLLSAPVMAQNFAPLAGPTWEFGKGKKGDPPPRPKPKPGPRDGGDDD